MSDALRFCLEVIRVDLIPGFGIYSILFGITRFALPQKNWLVQFDKSATSLVIYLGIGFGTIFIINLILIYSSLNTFEEISEFNNRLFGRYAFGVWLQPIFWVILTQLLRIKKLSTSIVYRVLISLLFIFSFERIVIISTSFHRDYLPSTWSMGGFSSLDILLGLVAKSLEFMALACLFHMASSKFKVHLFTD